MKGTDKTKNDNDKIEKNENMNDFIIGDLQKKVGFLQNAFDDMENQLVEIKKTMEIIENGKVHGVFKSKKLNMEDFEISLKIGKMNMDMDD
jgi:hypothetical protein